MALTKEDVDNLMFKVEFNLPIAEPELDALRGRLHLSERAERLLAQFHTQRVD